MTSYYPTIPQPTDIPANSQPQILSNFGTLNTDFGVDHLTYTAGVQPGMAVPGNHLKITLANVITDPTLLYPVSQIYSKSFGTSNNLNQELYFANTRQSHSQLNNLLPTVKVYGVVKYNGGTSWTLQSTDTLQVNVASIATDVNTVTINFTTALDYITYSVFFAVNQPSSSGAFSIPRSFNQLMGSFQFVTANPVNTLITFMVI